MWLHSTLIKMNYFPTTATSFMCFKFKTKFCFMLTLSHSSIIQMPDIISPQLAFGYQIWLEWSNVQSLIKLHK